MAGRGRYASQKEWERLVSRRSGRRHSMFNVNEDAGEEVAMSPYSSIMMMMKAVAPMFA